MGEYRLVCTGCGATPSKAFCPFCTECGQMTDVLYPLEQVRLADSPNPFLRFFDLLPLQDRSRLPQDSVYTPTHHAQALGDRLGMPSLYLKNETVLPTGTTKYRMAAVSLPYLAECGVSHFCTSSTGNSSTAYAQLIGQTSGLQMSVFTSEDFRLRVNYSPSAQMDHYILLDGSFVDAGQAAEAFAREHGYVAETGFFNPGRREGLKLAFLEAVEQIPAPIDWYVQAVSSAMGVYGTWKGARELLAIGALSQLPRLLCVQQVSCAPLARAWLEQASAIAPHHRVARPRGLAAAILRGDPSKAYPYIRTILNDSRGDCAVVSEQEIRTARELVQSLEGIEICFSAATAVAGMIQALHSGGLDPESVVMINLTGSDRQGEVPEDVQFMERREGRWQLVESPLPAASVLPG